MSPSPSLQTALDYAARGLPVFPVHGTRTLPDGTLLCTCGRPACPHPGKHPASPSGFHDATTDPHVLTSLFTTPHDQPRNLGLPTGTASGLVVVDVDPRNFPSSLAASSSYTDPFSDLALEVPELHHPTRRATTPSGGFHLFYRVPTVIPIRSVPGLRPGIDLKADGGYVILPPSQTPSGTYRFTTPDDLPALPLPPGLLLVQRAPNSSTSTHPHTSTSTGLTPAAIEAILADPTQLAPGQRDQFFFAAARDLRRDRGLTFQQTLEALTRVHSQMHNPPGDHFPISAVQAKVANAFNDPVHAHDPAPTPAHTIPQSLLVPTTQPQPSTPPAHTLPEDLTVFAETGWDGTWPEDDPTITLTTEGIGKLLRRVAGHRLRFCVETERWYACDPTTNRWGSDSVNGAARNLTERLMFLLRVHTSEHMSTTDDGQRLVQWCLRNSVPRFAKSVLESLEPDPTLWTKLSSFNPQHLLPVQNGVLDLSEWERHTTEYLLDGTPIPYHFQDPEEEYEYNLVTQHRFRDVRPEDLVTDTTRFEFYPEDIIYGQHHLQEWGELLEGWFPDPQVRAFAQRLFGYAAFGSDDQKLFVVAHGPPNSGKSAFFNNLRRLFGRYAATIPSTGIASPRGRMPDERNLAFINAHGTKLLIASESPPGAQFNLDVLKALTGGDPIITRGMRENGSTLDNHGTLILMTNHMPTNQELDAALWKRLVILPFENEFEPNQPGTLRPAALQTLLEKNSEEVLNWLVRGYLAFLREGLNPPRAVTLAKEDVQEDQDWLGQFLEDHVQAAPGSAPIELLDLYELYVAWAHVNKEEPVTYKTRFAPMVRNRLRRHVRRNARKRWTLVGHKVVTGPTPPTPTPTP